MTARFEQLDPAQHGLDDPLAGVQGLAEVVRIRTSALDPQLGERAGQDLAQDLGFVRIEGDHHAVTGMHERCRPGGG